MGSTPVGAVSRLFLLAFLIVAMLVLALGFWLGDHGGHLLAGWTWDSPVS